MFKVWMRAVTRPVVATYQELLEKEPNPSLSTALLLVLVAGAMSAVLAGVVILIAENGDGFYIRVLLTELLCVAVMVPIIVVMAFLIASGAFFAAAKVFGGEGTFDQQSYLLAAAYAPMSILMGGLLYLPCVGPWLSLICSLYTVRLVSLALQAAHHFSARKALLCVLAPLFLIVSSLICFIVILLLIGPEVGNVYTDIANEIQRR